MIIHHLLWGCSSSIERQPSVTTGQTHHQPSTATPHTEKENGNTTREVAELSLPGSNWGKSIHYNLKPPPKTAITFLQCLLPGALGGISVYSYRQPHDLKWLLPRKRTEAQPHRPDDHFALISTYLFVCLFIDLLNIFLCPPIHNGSGQLTAHSKI